MSQKKAVTKKKKTVKKMKAVSQPSTSEDIKNQIADWAYAGTEASLEQLDNFIAKEENLDLRDYALFVFDEAQYLYYVPKNEKEEKEFELARMIRDREDRLWRLMDDAERLEVLAQRVHIEETVHARLMKKQQAKTKEAWKYRYVGDMFGYSEQLQRVTEDIAYESAWIKEASAMITTKRYQHIPDDVFDQMDIADDDGYMSDDIDFMDDEWDDEDDCEDCGCHGDEVRHLLPEGEDIPF